jgi:hypothetical protein
VSSQTEPAVTSSLLADIARLRFRITTRDPDGNELGLMVDKPAHKPLLVESADGAGPQWTLGVPPPGATAHFITRETYEALRAATLGADGAITHQGRDYRLAARARGAIQVAELVPR